MDGGFPITPTPSSVTTSGPGPTPDSTTKAGFLEALTRSVGGVPASPVAAAVTPSVAPQAALPEMKRSWAGQAPVALDFAGGNPQGEPVLAAPTIALAPFGEAALVALQPPGPAGLIATVNAKSGMAESSLVPASEVGNGPKAEATAPDTDGRAMPPDADAIESVVDVATLWEGADQDSVHIDTADRSASKEDAIASEVMNRGIMAGFSLSQAQMPEAESGAVTPLPPHVDLTPSQLAQQLLSPQLHPGAIAPFAFASTLAALPSVQLQSVTPPDSPPKPATEAMAGELEGLRLQYPAMTSPPQLDGQSHLPERDALPEVTLVAVPVALPAPLRNGLAHQPAPQAADASPLAGLPVELGIASPTTQPYALQGPVLRPSDAAAPPPIRQLAPIAIALAFTPGAANGFNLTLDPVELGRVEIRVQREADGHSVRIMAERPETLALLQRDRHELDRSMADAGLRVVSDGIDFSLSNSGSGRDGPRDEGAPQAARSRGGPDTVELKAEPSPARATRGLLDLHI